MKRGFVTSEKLPEEEIEKATKKSIERVERQALTIRDSSVRLDGCFEAHGIPHLSGEPALV
jgi:hypothetical protein